MDELLSTPLAPLLGEARVRTYPKGQIILYEDDQPSEIYVLKRGIVRIYDIDDQGNEKILHIIRAPTLFPLVWHLGLRGEVGSFYGALTDCDAYLLPSAEFEARMAKDATLANYVLRCHVTEMHELLVRLGSMNKTTSYDKLIAALKFLAVHHAQKGRGKWYRVEFPVSHQLLADMTGITRESATMAIGQLQEEKIVRYPRLTVLEVNFEKLTQG
ncbi:MAG TPA: Crp/Fnr family transcriptional regulator [Candidatus Saccharimonadales bacterium]|nr:Crp/Fnr family transcriptional regulator [Candidatus Saccharimonadales bacterium]